MSFIEKTHKHHFQAASGVESRWAKAHGATHTIFMNDGQNNVRYARISKTVAHVIVDEAEDGSPIWESWQIRPLL